MRAPARKDSPAVRAGVDGIADAPQFSPDRRHRLREAALDIAPETGQLHVIDAVDQAKTVEHRRSRQHQHGQPGNPCVQVLAYGDHAANIAESKGVVRVYEQPYRPSLFRLYSLLSPRPEIYG